MNPTGAGPSVDFGYDQISEFFIVSLRSFVEGVSFPIAIGLWMLLFGISFLEGADELTGPNGGAGACRFFQGRWWLRFLLCGVFLYGYDQIVIGTLQKVQPQMMMSFGADWHQAWEESSDMLKRSQDAGQQNALLQMLEVLPMSDGSDVVGGGVLAAMGRMALATTDKIISALGALACYFTGGLLMLYVLMQGFYLAAVCTLLCALGPVFIAAGLHQKTEGMALNWIRAILLYLVFYGLMLVLSVRMGGGAMAAMDRMVIGAGVQFGDGSDVMVHLLQVVVGPMVVLVTLRAAPAVTTALLQVSIGSGEGGYGGMVGMVQQASQGLSRNMIDTIRRSGGGGGGNRDRQQGGVGSGGGSGSGRRDLGSMRGG
jgi:hypothetical protein